MYCLCYCLHAEYRLVDRDIFWLYYARVSRNTLAYFGTLQFIRRVFAFGGCLFFVLLLLRLERNTCLLSNVAV